LPLAVSRKRFLVALWVFCLGMVSQTPRSLAARWFFGKPPL
jgi:hypothetical protein